MDRRIASLLGNPGCDADSRRTWTTSVQGISQADSTRGRPHGPPVVLHPYRRVTPGGDTKTDPPGDTKTDPLLYT